MTTTQTPTTPAGPELPQVPGVVPPDAGLGERLRGYTSKIRGGDIGSLPAVLGLVTLVALFGAMRPDTFLTPLNFANLINQSAGIMILAMGLVFVLLLGEIDLSAGFAGGTAAATLGWASTEQGWPLIPSIVVCIATGVTIGLVIGLLVARLGIPSFVVTLAAFLSLQGLLLKIVGEGKTIPYRDQALIDINNATLPLWLGWTLTVVGLAAYGGLTLLRLLRRQKRGLSAEPVVLWGAKFVLLCALVIGAVTWLSVERSLKPEFISLKGVPMVVVLIVGLLICLNLLLNRTRWGRHVYAVGGNAEAARRSGINVGAVRISCFIICSSIAAIAGVVIASRNNSVSSDTGGAETLLFAVGAAVIGGTSLFGGKGRVVDAIIGGLLIAVISNGLLILSQPPSTFQIVTGGVLLLAAGVDAISRRRSQSAGLG